MIETLNRFGISENEYKEALERFKTSKNLDSTNNALSQRYFLIDYNDPNIVFYYVPDLSKFARDYSILMLSRRWKNQLLDENYAFVDGIGDGTILHERKRKGIEDIFSISERDENYMRRLFEHSSRLRFRALSLLEDAERKIEKNEDDSINLEDLVDACANYNSLALDLQLPGGLYPYIFDKYFPEMDPEEKLRLQGAMSSPIIGNDFITHIRVGLLEILKKSSDTQPSESLIGKFIQDYGFLDRSDIIPSSFEQPEKIFHELELLRKEYVNPEAELLHINYSSLNARLDFLHSSKMILDMYKERKPEDLRHVHDLIEFTREAMIYNEDVHAVRYRLFRLIGNIMGKKGHDAETASLSEFVGTSGLNPKFHPEFITQHYTLGSTDSPEYDYKDYQKVLVRANSQIFPDNKPIHNLELICTSFDEEVIQPIKAYGTIISYFTKEGIKTQGEFYSPDSSSEIGFGVLPQNIEEFYLEFPNLHEELSAKILEYHENSTAIVQTHFVVEEDELKIIESKDITPVVSPQLKLELASNSKESREYMLKFMDPQEIDRLLTSQVDIDRAPPPILKGNPVNKGVAVGHVAFSLESALNMAKRNIPYIYMVDDTLPSDLYVMKHSEGIINMGGSEIAHSATLARKLGKPCICNLPHIDYDSTTSHYLVFGSRTLKEGDVITLDGTNGNVYEGKPPSNNSKSAEIIDKLIKDIIKDSNIGHYANADTPDEIKEAIGLGAQGIGLCRTEHLIIEDNLINLQTFFLTDSEETKHDALIEFLTSHYNKFKQTYKLVGDMPLYVRLLDPPLSEFLPSPTEMSHIESLASAMGDDPNKIKNKIAQLKSDDSMLGLRGCRLGIVYPELYDAQIRAIFSAAKDVSEETGKLIKPTIILPFVINPDEVIHYKKRLDRISSQLGGIKYELGVMIETPSALYEIPRIAEHASNLSIGTNDLTMLFFGISRNDNSLSKIAESYSGEGIDLSMFSTLNKGLISLLSSQLQNIPPEIKVGFCGTHAADYKTIHQLYGSGMKFDYLSVEAPLLQRTVLLSESQRVNLHK